MTLESMHIAQTIGAKEKEVYDYASDPQNLPHWASGLSQTEIREENGKWTADSPMGKVEIKFCEKNSFGVLDHYVTIPSGETFYNPLRVMANQDGSEVVFTLYRWPGMSDEDFKKDAETIRKDLNALKEIVEKGL